MAEEQYSPESGTRKGSYVTCDKPSEQNPLNFLSKKELVSLRQAVGPPLIECMSELIEKRPRDPIEYMAMWLYNYQDSQCYFYNKIELSQKMMKAEQEREEEIINQRLQSAELNRRIKFYKLKLAIQKEEEDKMREADLQTRRLTEQRLAHTADRLANLLNERKSVARKSILKHSKPRRKERRTHSRDHTDSDATEESDVDSREAASGEEGERRGRRKGGRKEKGTPLEDLASDRSSKDHKREKSSLKHKDQSGRDHKSKTSSLKQKAAMKQSKPVEATGSRKSIFSGAVSRSTLSTIGMVSHDYEGSRHSKVESRRGSSGRGLSSEGPEQSRDDASSRRSSFRRTDSITDGDDFQESITTMSTDELQKLSGSDVRKFRLKEEKGEKRSRKKSKVPVKSSSSAVRKFRLKEEKGEKWSRKRSKTPGKSSSSDVRKLLLKEERGEKGSRWKSKAPGKSFPVESEDGEEKTSFDEEDSDGADGKKKKKGRRRDSDERAPADGKKKKKGRRRDSDERAPDGADSDRSLAEDETRRESQSSLSKGKQPKAKRFTGKSRRHSRRSTSSSVSGASKEGTPIQAEWTLDRNNRLTCFHPELGTLGVHSPLVDGTPDIWIELGFACETFYDHEIYTNCEVLTGIPLNIDKKQKKHRRTSSRRRSLEIPGRSQRLSSSSTRHSLDPLTQEISESESEQ